MEGEEDFDSNLSKLNDNSCLEDPKEALFVITSISNYLTSDLSKLSFQLYTSSLLDEQTGLVTFIRKAVAVTSKDSEFCQAINEAYTLIRYLIINFKKFVEPCIGNIISLCSYIVKNDITAAVKVCALKTTKEGISFCASTESNIKEIIACFKHCLTTQKKMKPTVTAEIYAVLGVIFEKYPERLSGEEAWFLNKILCTMRYQTGVAKNLSISIIIGCFEGLYGYLVNFQPNLEETSFIYDQLKRFSRQRESKKHVVHRTALKVFERHTQIFSKMIYTDEEFWHKVLLQWVKLQSEDSRSGFLALIAFYREIAKYLEKEQPENGKNVFQKYSQDFLGKIKNYVDSYPNRAALIGVGEFSSSYGQYSDENQLNMIFKFIMKRVQDVKPHENPISFSGYLETISKHISTQPGLRIEELKHLRKLSVLLIEHFPDIDPYFHWLPLEALEKSFYSVSTCGLQVLDNYITDVIYQGLIRTCGRPILIDIELQNEIGLVKMISYKSFNELWKYLLNLSASKTNIPFNTKTYLASVVFDSFIASFLKVITKLDLDVFQKHQDLSDPEFAMEAKRPKDFEIFINSVDLFQDLIPLTDYNKIEKWLNHMFKSLVNLSYKRPLVSGFYKIINNILTASDNLNFFDVKNVETSEMLMKYLEAILKKVDQYKGDLQIACLQTVLTAPVCLMQDLIERTVPAFKVILRVGRGYFPLLQLCIETLERWNLELPNNIIKPFLLQILPMFDSFLQSEGVRDFENSKNEKSRAIKTYGKVRKVSNFRHRESELLLLQKKFLKFLGTVSPNVTVALPMNLELEDRNIKEQFLTYSIPFTDVKPKIRLDDCIPRIMDLALSCSDRSTRITACELLHSIVIIALGNIKQKTGKLTGLFKKLLSVCLILGCDSDHLVQQFFIPLTLQITHYFSSNMQTFSQDTAALIEVLMENVAHPYDSAIRDFAAKSIREFIIWSIKHLTDEQLQKSDHNIRAILRIIYSFSLHPSYSKRLGAAVAFNSIYIELRNKTSFLDKYWFEIYYHFIECLKMSDDLEDRTQILNCIEHIKRPIKELSELFNVETDSRKVPPGFESNSLKHLVKWTLKRCSSTHVMTHKVAMSCVTDLAPKVLGCNSLIDYFRIHVTDVNVSFDLDSDFFNVKQAQFDYYAWVLHENLAPTSKINMDIIKEYMDRTLIDKRGFEIVVSFLEFLKEVLDKGESSKKYLDEDFRELLKFCVFDSKKLNVDLEKLKKILGVIFDLELDSELLFGGIQIDRSNIQNDKSGLLEGFILIEKAGRWKDFNQLSKICISGEEIIYDVFTSLFKKSGKKIYTENIDVHYKDNFLAFGLKIKPNYDLVVEYVNNKEKITVSDTCEETTKGEYFFKSYQNSILDFLIENVEQLFSKGRNHTLLLPLLEHIYQSEEVGNFRTIATRAVYDNWDDFCGLQFETQLTKNKFLMSLLKQTTMLDSIGCLKREVKIGKWVCDTFDCQEVGFFLQMLIYLAGYEENVHENPVLEEALATFRSAYVLCRAHIDDKRTIVTLYEKLFQAVEVTGSIVVLSFILEILQLHGKYIHDDLIFKCLENFVKRFSPEHVGKAIDCVYKAAFFKTSVNHEYQAIAGNFLNILLITNEDVFKCLKDIIKELCEVILKPFTSIRIQECKVEVVKRTTAVTLFQVVYRKLDRKEVESICNEFPPLKSNLEAIISELSNVNILPDFNHRELAELSRKYACACFNTLCVVITERTNDPKPYRVYLFHRNLWSRIVDNKKKINLEIDFEEIPKRRKKLTLLRNTITIENKNQTGEALRFLRYMKTQTIFESTLNEDVTKFDFTHASLRPLDSIENTGKPEKVKNSEVELEIDEINDHESMAEIVSVIKHITANVRSSDIPVWLDSILETLNDDGTKPNTKIFLLKILWNCEKLVKPFARKVIPVIVDTLWDLFKNKPINYFLMDILYVLMDWRCNLEEDDSLKVKLTELVKNMIEKVDSCRKDVVKNNLELLKTIIEVWKKNLELEELSEFVDRRISVGTANYVNLHVIGVLLVNDIQVWKFGEEVNFFQKILKAFENNKKDYYFALEVVGMSLALAEKKCNDFENVFDSVVSTFRRVFLGDPNAVTFLHVVQKHYPRIATEFLSTVVMQAWSVKGKFAKESLEIILTHVSRLVTLEEDNFTATFDQFIADMLKSHDPEVKSLVLKIILKMIHFVDCEGIFQVIVNLRTDKHLEVRKSVYELCMWWFDHSESQDLKLQSKISLIKGLTDSSEEVQKLCQNFWCESRMESKGVKRMIFIMRELYTPDTEEGFLNYCVRLMLEACTKSVDYKEPIFSAPLSECSYKDINIINSWRAQHSTIAPMFAQTIVSQLTKPETLLTENDFLLRSTLESLLITPTVVEEDTNLSPNSNSFRNGIPNLTLPNLDVNEFRVPSFRRFLRKKQSISSYFARKEMKKKRDSLEKEEERIKKSEKCVELYRQYRTGDFPDIQITHSNILKPLEVLAKKDSQIALLFLISLYTAIIEYLKPQNSEEISNGATFFIDTILANSTDCNPGVLAFAFHVALYDRRINVAASHVKASAKISGHLSLGALLIEQGLIKKSEELEEVAKKRKQIFETSEKDDWLHLADLYRSLKEFDVVRGIFLDKLEVDKNAIEAIRSEANSNWNIASHFYKCAIDGEERKEMLDFYSQSYYSCLANLSDWKGLNESITKFIQSDIDRLWSESSIYESVLPWYLKSEMMLSLKENKNDFENLLKNICSVKARNSVVAQKFGKEVAVFNFLTGKCQKSQFFVDRLCTQFLHLWPHLSKWSEKLRAEKIGNLQLISEINVITSAVNAKTSEAERNIETMINNWKKNVPQSRDDLLIWDFKIAYRKTLLKHFPEHTIIKKAILESELALIQAALKQNNFYLARNYLESVRNDISEYASKLTLRHFENTLYVVRGRLCQKKVDKELNQYAIAWHEIAKSLNLEMELDSELQSVFFFKTNLLLGKLISDIIVRVPNVSPKDRERVVHMTDLSENPSEDELISVLNTKGLDYLIAAKNLVERLDGYEKNKAKTYLEIANFYKRFMDMTYWKDSQEFVLNILRAMKLGNIEASNLFCAILALPQIMDGPIEELLRRCKDVPVWMFLRWTNQMLASLDTKIFQFIKPIIRQIAEEYPNAIRHAFRLSKQNYAYGQPGTKEFVDELTCTLLQDSLQEKLLTALTYVGPPQLMLKYYLEKIQQQLSSDDENWFLVDFHFKNLMKHLYAEDDVLRGDAFKVIEKHRQKVGSLSQGPKDKITWKNKAAEIVSNIDLQKDLRNTLKSYSPWLSEFRSMNYDNKIEVPGQYDGCRKPNVKYHVTISSFKSDLFKLKSKCRPMRLTILGNDAVDYNFMVKFGEDLRQDQRIQQIFNYINETLRKGNSTGNLSLDTYNVIPLTTSLGMIQWIDGTVSLQALILDSYEPKESLEVLNKMRMDHLAFYAGGRNFEKPTLVQLDAYLHVNRSEAIENYNKRVHSFPWNALRNSILKISTSFEHFVFLRSNFATSQAVMFIGHWLMGIGDRHLQNTLVSQKTGRVLGIDFGYAFGFATQFLPLPELVPFRLTPQIKNLMKPLNESGWTKQTMIHCLRCLRKDPIIFLAILEIFVLEPSLEWLEAKKRVLEGNTKLHENWYPKKKVSIVKEKLEGGNPTVALKKDLEANSLVQQRVIKKCCEILQGNEYYNVRTKYDSCGLTVEEQVDCLIDLATDEHILAKAFVGWDSWL